MTYPDGIDALVNVNANDTLAAGGHAARHNSVNTALVEVKDYLVGALGSKLPIAGGKILQIVRATDSTGRTTTSTSFVDVTGMSVTITPQKNDSAILLLASFILYVGTSANDALTRITDASNNAISGAESVALVGPANFQGPQFLSARSTPATINATTYKLQFRTGNGAVSIQVANSQATGEMYAIEVSA
jgi:hypothetical protein